MFRPVVLRHVAIEAQPLVIIPPPPRGGARAAAAAGKAAARANDSGKSVHLVCDESLMSHSWLRDHAHVVRRATVTVWTPWCGERPRSVSGGRKGETMAGEEFMAACRDLGVPTWARTDVKEWMVDHDLSPSIKRLVPEAWVVRGHMGREFDAFVSLHGREAERLGVRLILDYVR